MQAYYLVLISIIIFIILAAWGVKFPRSRHDWKKDRSETFALFITIIIFLILFFMLWYVVSVITWPGLMDMIIWSSIITFLIILAAAIFLPHGIKVKLGKKDKKVQEED